MSQIPLELKGTLYMTIAHMIGHGTLKACAAREPPCTLVQATNATDGCNTWARAGGVKGSEFEEQVVSMVYSLKSRWCQHFRVWKAGGVKQVVSRV